MKSIATLALAALLAAPLAPPAALAQDADALVQGLLPKRPLTRGLTGAPATRQIKVEGVPPEKVLEEIKDQPSVSVRVLFEYNSAKLTPQGMATLQTLGKALQDPRLSGARFLIAGHTDARGSDEYNQKLSESRANAVREHLTQTFRISPDKLSSIGFGRKKPADPAHPEEAVNRRVEVVNLTQ
jgi:outer membrane protein OmpA-like peptidoglycan-associated protein